MTAARKLQIAQECGADHIVMIQDWHTVNHRPFTSGVIFRYYMLRSNGKFEMYKADVDYDKFIDLVFKHDKVICWW